MNPSPTVADRRTGLLRRLALAALLLMAVLVVASAWLRLAQPRPACVDWPGCRTASRPELGTAAAAGLGQPAVLTTVRGVHRIAASALLLVVVALALLAATRSARDPMLLRRTLTMLALALGLAALGVVTHGARSTAVLLGNLLGGLLLFALAWTTRRGLSTAPAPRPALTRWALAGALLWALQAGFGARSGAGAGDVAPVAHLALALLATPWAFVVGLAARRQGCRVEGAALMALAALQAVLGAVAATTAAAPALVLVHNSAAAIGLALLLGLGLAPAR